MLSYVNATSNTIHLLPHRGTAAALINTNVGAFAYVQRASRSLMEAACAHMVSEAQAHAAADDAELLLRAQGSTGAAGTSCGAAGTSVGAAGGSAGSDGTAGMSSADDYWCGALNEVLMVSQPQVPKAAPSCAAGKRERASTRVHAFTLHEHIAMMPHTVCPNTICCILRRACSIRGGEDRCCRAGASPSHHFSNQAPGLPPGCCKGGGPQCNDTRGCHQVHPSDPAQELPPCSMCGVGARRWWGP